MNYPWHESQWQQFLKSYHKDALPHALLLHGTAGLAKKQFAFRMAQLLLCDKDQRESPCGDCHGCKLFLANNHPDFILVEPEEKTIGIAQIRELILQLQLTQHSAQYKTVIINPATTMTHAAGNALLKSLEEPPAARTILILIAESIALLPATIVSRCQRLSFSSPNQSILQEWLKAEITDMPVKEEDILTLCAQYDNAPLRILSALTTGEMQQIKELYLALDGLRTKKTNPMTLANQWQRFAILTLLDWIWMWVSLQIKEKIHQPLPCQHLFTLIDDLQQIKQTFLRHVTLNQLLLLESLFIKCQEIVYVS